ncbi:MAG: AAA family ATPase [Candidatus Odinarchaeota archaeon]
MGTWIPLLVIKEKELLEKRSKLGTNPPIVVAIGGLSGTGKDTLSNRILERINSDYGIQLQKYNAGDFIRELAVKNGFPPEDLDKFVDKVKDEPGFSRKVDIFIEEQTLTKAIEGGGIFTGRMAPFTIGNHGFTVFLKADPLVIANRLVNDENRAEYGCQEEQVARKIRKRDKADIERLKRVYSINFEKLLEKVDLVLDTCQLTIEESVEKIFSEFKKKFSLSNQE